MERSFHVWIDVPVKREWMDRDVERRKQREFEDGDGNELFVLNENPKILKTKKTKKKLKVKGKLIKKSYNLTGSYCGVVYRNCGL